MDPLNPDFVPEANMMDHDSEGETYQPPPEEDETSNEHSWLNRFKKKVPPAPKPKPPQPELVPQDSQEDEPMPDD